MELNTNMNINPETVKNFFEKFCNSKQDNAEKYKTLQYHNEAAYRYSLIDPNLHIVIEREKNNNSVTVYTNDISTKGVLFVDSIAKSIPSTKICQNYKNSGLSYGDRLWILLNKNFSLAPDKGLLRLAITSQNDIELLLIWYFGQSISKESLANFLIEDDYRCFPDSMFEPSNKTIIPTEEANDANLSKHLMSHYKTGKSLDIFHDRFEEILGADQAKKLINGNTSDYIKITAHFAILSTAKRGWFNFFVPKAIRKLRPSEAKKNFQAPVPSLSDNPSPYQINDVKELNDAVIYCFYRRLIEGMTETEQAAYKILSLEKTRLPVFRRLLFDLEQTIDNLFNFLQKDIEGYDDVFYPPDMGLNEIISKTRYLVLDSLKNQKNTNPIQDSLRASLIKNATINLAINDLEAIQYIHEKVRVNLPEEITPLVNIQSESDILSAISYMFNMKPDALPSDLIDCAKAVIKIYTLESYPKLASKETVSLFINEHKKPYCLAISAALLLHDSIHKTEIKIGIKGNTNKGKPSYHAFSNIIKSTNGGKQLTHEFLQNHKIYEDLFNYLFTRYSVSVFGLSPTYSSREGALAHLNVKAKKLELKKEILEQLSELSISDIECFITSFYRLINDIVSLPSQSTHYSRTSTENWEIVDFHQPRFS